MTRYDLAGRTVAITGGTGGFARALAPVLRERGANIALLDLDADQLRDTAAAIGPATVARGWVVDVRQLDHLEQTMDDVAEHFGRLDVVIANAGLGDVGVPLAEDDPAHWDRMVDINLNGVYRTFRAAFPHISKANGYLLATSSMAAFVHNPLQGAYPASKAGVWALCDTWRLDVRKTGVAVGSLHPTFFKTPMFDAIHANPAINRLWNGNGKGIWKMADIDVVVRRTVRGIERRSAHIVAPRSLAISALAPGLAQAVVERIGLRGSTIPDAIALSQPQSVNAATGIRKANR
jgi:NAD(P)-dependent dehydrogenase (short-subunit alcohol dehydrogenase family)